VLVPLRRDCAPDFWGPPFKGRYRFGNELPILEFQGAGEAVG